MNNFPAMTEEQRQELIQHATEEIRLKTEHIARLEKHMPGQFNTSRYQMEVLTAKVALAALTAKPVGTIRIETDWNIHRNVATLYMGKDLVAADMATGDKLFTAPPAPVLRVPDELRNEDAPSSFDAHEADCWLDGASWMLGEVKRMNGSN